MSDTEINVSKEKITGTRGSMLTPGPSTIKAGTTLAPLNVGPPNASADAGDWQTRDVKADQYPAAHGMKSRTANDGSPGGVLGKPARPVKR
jgi:hypothetical protein